MSPQDAAEMASLLSDYYPELPLKQVSLAREKFEHYPRELVEQILKDYRATHSEADITAILDLCRGKNKVHNYQSNAAVSKRAKKKIMNDWESLKEKVAHFGSAKKEHLKSAALSKQEAFLAQELADKDPMQSDTLLSLVAVEAGLITPKDRACV